jgi:hypothetical protein
VIHFYHMYLGGDWRTIADAHLGVLRQRDFAGEVHVTLIGPPEVREEAKAWLGRRWSYKLAAEADEGFEDITLNAIWDTIKDLPDETPILYAHNKGSFHVHVENNAWRRAMTEYLVEFWKTRVAELAIYDVMAWTWLPVGEYDIGRPAGPEIIDEPMASGNFWWANAGYLRKLDPPPTGLVELDRIEAELWLGRGNPRVGYEKLGWPRVFVPLKWVPSPTINGIQQPGGHWEQDENS